MPAHGSAGFGGDGDGVGMPDVWHSYPIQELERCLTALRDHDPRARRHVLGRYCWGDRIQLRARRQGGRLIGLPDRSEPVGAPVATGERRQGYELVTVVVLTWPRWVLIEHVDRGLDTLTSCYRGEPMLPKAMIAA